MTLEQRIESGRMKMFSKAAKWAISSARAVLWLTVLIMLVGCFNRQSATIVPGTNLRGAKNFYVVTFPPDKRGINRLIADQLNFMGHRATTGPEDTAPKNADVIVTYRDKWMWDITMYMRELTVTFRDPENKFPLWGWQLHSWILNQKITQGDDKRSPDKYIQQIIEERTGIEQCAHFARRFGTGSYRRPRTRAAKPWVFVAPRLLDYTLSFRPFTLCGAQGACPLAG